VGILGFPVDSAPIAEGARSFVPDTAANVFGRQSRMPTLILDFTASYLGASPIHTRKKPAFFRRTAVRLATNNIEKRFTRSPNTESGGVAWTAYAFDL